jgi:precorrin-3B synthase
MPAGDGLLARVRPPAGRLSIDQAEALADAARGCGNGTIEISSRANVQLRGLAPEKLGELGSRLAAIGLLDADPAVERVRNIVASPLSDLDPDASCDAAPFVAALEARITIDADLRALPAKFGFVIDAGGRWPLSDIEGDVRFEGFVSGDGLGFAVRLASPLAGPAFALIRPDGLPDAAARLARAFRALAGHAPDAPRRMRGLVERHGAAAVFSAAGLQTAARAITSAVAGPRASVGILDLGGSAALGIAPPFGRMTAEAFAGLARAARECGASGARLTPWRTIVLPGLDAAGAGALAGKLAALGFIVAPGDTRLGVVACPGAPACAHANADTLAGAARLAASLPRARGLLHVSGCAKGCAHAAPARLTLVATPEGYDLVIGGRAGDAPAHRGLSLASAAALAGGLAA